jgi:hypothetical protein
MQPWEKDRIIDPGDAIGSTSKAKASTYQLYEYACHEGNQSLGIAMIATYNEKNGLVQNTKPPVAESVASLVGGSEADVRARYGEPVEIDGPRWEYATTEDFVPFYVFFQQGKVVRVRPDDLRLNQVVKR